MKFVSLEQIAQLEEAAQKGCLYWLGGVIQTSLAISQRCNLPLFRKKKRVK